MGNEFFSESSGGVSGNTVIFNQGLNPAPSFNFLLRVEGVFDMPCRAIHVFQNENEFELIQEGGLNDYVHMRRKPISKPFTFQVERYVNMDFLDPLANGTELALPVLLFVSRYSGNLDTFEEFPVRIYVFTGCTVMSKQYGELNSEKSGLLVETTTLAYRQLFCINNPNVNSQRDPWEYADKKLTTKYARTNSQRGMPEHSQEWLEEHAVRWDPTLTDSTELSEEQKKTLNGSVYEVTPAKDGREAETARASVRRANTAKALGYSYGDLRKKRKWEPNQYEYDAEKDEEGVEIKRVLKVKGENTSSKSSAVTPESRGYTGEGKSAPVKWDISTSKSETMRAATPEKKGYTGEGKEASRKWDPNNVDSKSLSEAEKKTLSGSTYTTKDENGKATTAQASVKSAVTPADKGYTGEGKSAPEKWNISSTENKTMRAETPEKKGYTGEDKEKARKWNPNNVDSGNLSEAEKATLSGSTYTTKDENGKDTTAQASVKSAVTPADKGYTGEGKSAPEKWKISSTENKTMRAETPEKKGYTGEDKEKARQWNPNNVDSEKLSADEKATLSGSTYTTKDENGEDTTAQASVKSAVTPEGEGYTGEGKPKYKKWNPNSPSDEDRSAVQAVNSKAQARKWPAQKSAVDVAAFLAKK